MHGSKPGLGYLKPLFRRDALQGLAYREDLRIGEDYDLVVRLLAARARMVFEPAPLYRYRKHGASISAVLEAGHIEQMIRADAEVGISPNDRPALRAQARRRRSLETALAYDRAVRALKSRQVIAAVAEGLRRPSVLPLLRLHKATRSKRFAARQRTRPFEAEPVGA